MTEGMPPNSFGGAQLTVLLATNDVAEAERECDRVAFLYHGRLVAVDTPVALKQGLRHESVLVECHDGAVERLEREVGGWPGVGGARAAGGVLHVTVEDAASFVPRLFQSGGDGIRAVRIEESSLEDAYFQLVGASLTAAIGARDPDAEGSQ
jgi:ABC-2 type transport system ATP-binding protein